MYKKVLYFIIVLYALITYTTVYAHTEWKTGMGVEILTDCRYRWGDSPQDEQAG